MRIDKLVSYGGPGIITAALVFGPSKMTITSKWLIMDSGKDVTEKVLVISREKCRPITQLLSLTKKIGLG